MKIDQLIKLARPRHWIKNGVILIPLIFSREILSLDSVLTTLITVISFCLLSSFAYIINDIRDRASDRSHPAKQKRPLAAGTVTVNQAVVLALILLISGLIAAFLASKAVLAVSAAYCILQVFYTLILKDLALIDVISISMGFVVRAAAGLAAVQTEVSPWLFICLFTLCLFMGFCKRYNEMVAMDMNHSAGSMHRKTLIEYSQTLLTHLITLSAAVAVVAFLLYSLNERTVSRFGTDYFVYTLPVVVYGVFRFAMLSMKGVYTDPTDLMLKDRPFQLTVIIWLLLASIIIFAGRDIAGWLTGI
jgi:4-hydroxybenzoate polyprenyltransferase